MVVKNEIEDLKSSQITLIVVPDYFVIHLISN